MIEEFNPLVTIIIPVYNGSNYLQYAIDSALKQTYKNIEVIVVNDGSDDEGKTRYISLLYGNMIKYFEKENGGVASALNLGIERMSGEYFSWLSHDDVYYEKKIEKQINYLINSNQNVILFSDYDIIDDNGKYVCSRAMPDIIPQDFRLWITLENILHGCTLLIPKECFIRCGGFNESLKTTQDYDLWFRLAEYYDFIRVPEILVKSRYHSEQTTRTISSKVMEECNLLMISFFERLKCNDNESNLIIANSFYQRNFFLSSYVAYKEIFNNTTWLSFQEKIMYIIMIFRSLCKILLRYKYMMKYLYRIKSNNKSKFTYYYHSNTFKSNESKSGEGSTLEQTKTIREIIPKIIKDYDVSIFIDAPCGDFNWMQHVDMELLKQYYGIDIVEEIIENNRIKYSDEKKLFLNIDIVNDLLPFGDLILCRDCLVHLTFRDGVKAIRNIKKSKIKYLLITTFVDRKKNYDLRGKDVWRPINMQLSPFNFPKPIVIFNEGCTEGNNNFRDKCLALFRLEDIRI